MTASPTHSAPPGMRRVQLATGAALAVSAIVIGLLLLEVATRAVFDRNGTHFGIEMWKYARLIKQPSAVASMGHEHAPNREAVLMGVTVRTNSVGLRDREFAYERHPAVRRIMVLGDSMTFGWGAREEDTYPKVLERLLNEAGHASEVINTGVGNYNTSQEVAYFRERGLRYRPDTVIIGFYINDAEPTPVPVEGMLARLSYLYVLTSSGFDAFERRMGWKKDLRTYYEDLFDDRNPGWVACRAALAELSRLTRSIGASPLVAIIPELHAANAHYPFHRVHRLVETAARRENLPVLDLTPAFVGIDPPSLWVSRGDTHPNARAHEIIARSLFEAMTSGDHDRLRPEPGRITQ